MALKVTSNTGFIVKLEEETGNFGEVQATSASEYFTLTDQAVAKCFVRYGTDSQLRLNDCAIVLDNSASSGTSPQVGIRLCARLMEHARRQLEGLFQKAHRQSSNGPSSSEKLPVAALCAPHIDCLAALDAAVRILAHSLRLDLIVFDPVDFSDGASGIFGPQLSEKLWRLFYMEQTASGVAEGLRCMRSIMRMGLPGDSSRGRLLYLRDFGTFRHALSDRLLHAIHAASSSEPRTIVVTGIVPVCKAQTTDDMERTSRNKSPECEEFLREMKGESFLDFLKRRYNTYTNFVGQYTCLEELFSAAFAEHYQGGEIRGTIPQAKEPNVQAVVVPARPGGHSAVSEGTPSRTDLHLEFTTLVRVSLTADLPQQVAEIAKDSQQRRFVGANICLLNLALRKLGKSLQGPESETDWKPILEGQSKLALIKDLGNRIHSPPQRMAIAEALPHRSSIADLSEAVRVAVDAEEAWKLQVDKVISEQPFDPVVSEVGTGGSLSPQEKALLSCVVDPSTIRTRLEDVCLTESVQRTLRVMIKLPLTHPDAFKEGILAAEFGGGILLYGPPGTGKTMVSRALAKENGVRMLQIQSSTIQRSAVGESEQKVSAVFGLARKLGPCIVFIDELDAFFSRQNEHTPVWHRSLVTEILQEMDGLRTASLNREKGVIVVAATNRPQDLDDAIVRRLPRRVFIDLPARKDREKILDTYLKHNDHDECIPSVIAAKTTLYSGSDLRHLVVAAALVAVQEAVEENSGEPKPPATRKITVGDFNKALKDVLPSCASDMKALESLRSWGGRSGRGAEEHRGIVTRGEFGITIGGPMGGIKVTQQVGRV